MQVSPLRLRLSFVHGRACALEHLKKRNSHVRVAAGQQAMAQDICFLLCEWIEPL